MSSDDWVEADQSEVRTLQGRAVRERLFAVEQDSGSRDEDLSDLTHHEEQLSQNDAPSSDLGYGMHSSTRTNK